MGYADMELNYLEIGQNIRKYRLQRGLKQKELAEKTNVSPQHISHIETGRGQLSLPTLVAIANVLCVDCNTLLGKTLTGAQGYLYRDEIEQILSKMEPREVLLCLELCRSVARYNEAERT